MLVAANLIGSENRQRISSLRAVEHLAIFLMIRSQGIAKSAWLNSWRVTISIAGAGTLGDRHLVIASQILSPISDMPDICDFIRRRRSGHT